MQLLRGATCFWAVPDTCRAKRAMRMQHTEKMRARACAIEAPDRLELAAQWWLLAAGILLAAGRIWTSVNSTFVTVCLVRDGPRRPAADSCGWLHMRASVNGASQSSVCNRIEPPHVRWLLVRALTLTPFTGCGRRSLSLGHRLLAVLPRLMLPMHACNHLVSACTLRAARKQGQSYRSRLINTLRWNSSCRGQKGAR